MAEFAEFHQPAPRLPKESRVVLPARLRRMSSKQSGPRPAVSTPVDSVPANEHAVDDRQPSTGALRHQPGPRGGEDYRMLTTEQAYRAVYRFVERYQGRSHDPETARLLQWMAIQANGVTSHPAMWPDWLDSVDETLRDLAGPGAPLGEPSPSSD